VVKEASVRLATPNRHLERAGDELLVVHRARRPTDDEARVEVEHGRVAPGSLFTTSDRYRSCIRVSGAFWSDRIRDAIRTLGGIAAALARTEK
jgi:hypothetical protein